MNNEQLRRQLMTTSTERDLKSSDYLSTGSALLNLACSGRLAGGYTKGHYTWFVGDSDSGKTFFVLNAFAEAARNPAFNSYRFVYDNGEDGALMDLKRFFGKKMADRLEPPMCYEDGTPAYSKTVNEFYFNVDDALSEGPCIYVQDSMDVLSSDSEQDKFKKLKTAYRQGKDSPGIMTDGKAKINSASLRTMVAKVRDTESILIIISQTRDTMSTFGGKSASGGRALKFYATLEIWSSVKEKIYAAVLGRKRYIGNLCKLDVKRTRVTGSKSQVFIPIYPSYGIDDLGSCIQYLIDEKVFKKSKASPIINADDLGIVGPMSKLLKAIENEGLEKDLHLLVQDRWEEVADACALHRKNRYE